MAKTRYEHWKASRKRHPQTRNRQRQRYYDVNRADPRNTRNSRDEWTLVDMNAITAPDKPSDRELSAKLGRSMKAIQVKRVKIKASEREATSVAVA